MKPSCVSNLWSLGRHMGTEIEIATELRSFENKPAMLRVPPAATP